jgi:hypothetical protein
MAREKYRKDFPEYPVSAGTQTPNQRRRGVEQRRGRRIKRLFAGDRPD